MAAADSTPVGARFSRLVVVGAPFKEKSKAHRVKCRCDCGNEKFAICTELIKGHTKSCGCLVRDRQKERHPIPVGKRFGKLVVLGEAPKTGANRKVFAACDCGTRKSFVIHNLTNGHTTSCGCDRSGPVKHGYARKDRSLGNRTYAVYRDMRTRCENPNYPEYHLYGGRGITICARWLDSFENFLSDMGERPTGMTLERVRVNEGYSPENCCWATALDQALNRRTNVFIEYQGRRLTVSQWASELGLNAKRMYYGVKKGWPPERLLAK